MQSIFKLIYYVDLSRFELMVHLIWHQYGIIKLGKLKYDFMSPTNKIWIIVSKTRKTLILYLNDTEWGFDVMHSSKQWFIQACHPQTWLFHRLTKTLVMCDLPKMLNIHFFLNKIFCKVAQTDFILLGVIGVIKNKRLNYQIKIMFFSNYNSTH